MNKKHITLVAAARPNFMKISPLAHALKKSPYFEFTLVHTGQHFDQNMSDTFFNQLNIPEPDINLNIGGGSHAYQTGMVMIKFEEYLQKNKTDMVIVVGDVNATVACSLSAKKCLIPVAHVESGLRSFDRDMPEEMNRLVTDQLSDILYTPSEDADSQLLKENIDPKRIVFVGNIMIDTLLSNKEIADTLTTTSSFGVLPSNYALLTLHRPSNVDNIDIFSEILSALESISTDMPIIWPIHPRTKKNIDTFGLLDRVQTYLITTPPLGYHEMLHLMSNSKLVLTDSGGLQEESSVLNIPCITIRNNTERPITLSEGTNILAGTTKQGILNAYSETLQKNNTRCQIKYWDGKTASRIVSHLQKYFFNH